jgi:hypothetical protein
MKVLPLIKKYKLLIIISIIIILALILGLVFPKINEGFSYYGYTLFDDERPYDVEGQTISGGFKQYDQSTSETYVTIMAKLLCSRKSECKGFYVGKDLQSRPFYRLLNNVKKAKGYSSYKLNKLYIKDRYVEPTTTKPPTRYFRSKTPTITKPITTTTKPITTKPITTTTKPITTKPITTTTKPITTNTENNDDKYDYEEIDNKQPTSLFQTLPGGYKSYKVDNIDNDINDVINDAKKACNSKTKCKAFYIGNYGNSNRPFYRLLKNTKNTENTTGSSFYSMNKMFIKKDKQNAKKSTTTAQTNVKSNPISASVSKPIQSIKQSKPTKQSIPPKINPLTSTVNKLKKQKEELEKQVKKLQKNNQINEENTKTQSAQLQSKINSTNNELNAKLNLIKRLQKQILNLKDENKELELSSKSNKNNNGNVKPAVVKVDLIVEGNDENKPDESFVGCSYSPASITEYFYDGEEKPLDLLSSYFDQRAIPIINEVSSAIDVTDYLTRTQVEKCYKKCLI